MILASEIAEVRQVEPLVFVDRERVGHLERLHLDERSKRCARRRGPGLEPMPRQRPRPLKRVDRVQLERVGGAPLTREHDEEHLLVGTRLAAREQPLVIEAVLRDPLGQRGARADEEAAREPVESVEHHLKRGLLPAALLRQRVRDARLVEARRRPQTDAQRRRGSREVQEAEDAHVAPREIWRAEEVEPHGHRDQLVSIVSNKTNNLISIKCHFRRNNFQKK